MKRVVLLLLASAAAVVVLLSLTGGIDLVGPARLLVVAGGIIIVMASVDELVQAAKAQGSVESEAPLARENASEAPSPSEVPLPPQPAVAPVSEPALVLASADTVIDLRDQPTTLVDELIADGRLSNSREPIGDHEVPAIVMAALAHQLSLQAA